MGQVEGFMEVKQSSYQFRAADEVAPKSTLNSLEVLLVEVGKTAIAIRASRVGRLRQYNPDQLLKPEELGQVGFPGFLGFMGAVGLPLIDLATLLELESSLADKTFQVLTIEQNNLMLGFVVGATQEIERVSLKDIQLLPPLIEEMRLKPAVWGLWQQSQDKLIPLVEPTAALSAADLQFLIETSANQAI